MEMLYGTPFPVTPGSENGFKSSYGTIPAPLRFLNLWSVFLASMMPSSSFSLPWNLSNAAFIIGSSFHAGSGSCPRYSSSGEWFDNTSRIAITFVAWICDGKHVRSATSGLSQNILSSPSVGVVAGGHPDYGGDNVDEVRWDLEVGPPRGVFLVAMADGPDLSPPGLELLVRCDAARVGVVVIDVVGDPLLDGVPQEEAVVGEGVVLDR
ncbi:hypothetical protein EUGRSUZ_J00826 [Eucalyptus grandis]|uniref:Uncharacterized protein n=2 Tax=Eucalyptus grandis TaxID=71139 RepID=A0ACC3J3J4_EUCGR|nr:hypothetical protein EUGRSUZ_J00826 [Eucalyptus grandis]